MIPPVEIVGLGGDGLVGLTPRALAAIQAATFLAGGRRNLQTVGKTRAETFTITNNLADLIARLARRGPVERCVVLASGDPLFFGVGHAISTALGRDQVRVETSASSMQLAFARVGIAWHDATIASVHGRPLKATLLPLLGRPKIGLFTRDGAGPSRVARFFHERGLDDYDVWVCENLNAPDERVALLTIADVVGRSFSDLNVVVLLRRGPDAAQALEVHGASFARPESGPVLLTHEDVRSLVLRRFEGLGDGPVWDVGAGLGGVAVELARANPAREVVAVERADEQIRFLKINRARFGAYNLRVVEGEAPGCLAEEPPPVGVFLGGSGGRLDEILSVVAGKLVPGGRFVANFVGLENLARSLDRLRALGWRTELTQIQICEGRPLAGLTTLVPCRPVWIVRADKP